MWLTRPLRERSTQVFLGVLFASLVIVSVLHVFMPQDSALYVSSYTITLLGKYLCYALLAVAVDLVWGYLGILSLGHGAFFALGGYAMGMYLMRQIGDRGVYGDPMLPDFMVFLNWQELPWYWLGFDMAWFAFIMVLLAPGILALVFGFLAFRSRVTGVYLSIITQALTFALMLAFFRNEMGFGSRHNLLTLSEPDIASLGIGRKFQKPTVFEALTVFENLELAMATDKRVLPTLTAQMTPEYRDRIDEVLEMIGLKELRQALAGILSHGQKQWLEIGMLLMQKPRLLLVDEPVAGMTEQEMERTAELLTSLAGKQSVVVVEHDMGFVRSIARKVTVLHQGSVLAEGSMDQVSNDPEVIKVYLGEEA